MFSSFIDSIKTSVVKVCDVIKESIEDKSPVGAAALSDITIDHTLPVPLSSNQVEIKVESETKVAIYVLELEDAKYYVGKTTNINFRLDDHFSNKGSAWTIKYKPMNVLKIIPNCDHRDEDKYTLMYMELFGIDSVRGGSFNQITLSDEDKMIINKMINTANNNCYRCGNHGHFIKQCNVDVYCTRCGRNNHMASNCYAKTTFSGEELVPEACAQQARLTSVPEVCAQQARLTSVPEACAQQARLTSVPETKFCTRCGRNNHNIESCYAKIHFDGSIINYSSEPAS